MAELDDPTRSEALPRPARAAALAVVQTGASALLVGLLQVALAVSFAALVFSGELAPFVGAGVGFALYAAAASGIVVALLACVPGTIGNAKGIAAALLAAMAAGVIANIPAGAPPEARFVTVVVAIGIAGLSTGLFLLALGRFHLGRLVRFLPYPVIGGFVTGTGWLLTESSMELLSGLPLEPAALPRWLAPDIAPEWLLGAAVAALLLTVTAVVRHPLALPVAVAAIFAAFAAWVGLADTSWTELQERGWLLGPFPSGGLWRPGDIAPLSAVQWPAIGSQAAAVVIIALIAAMEVLLNATGMEVELGVDLDLDRELRTAGLASVAAGAGGGMVGYQVLSLTLLGHRLGGRTRAAAAIASGVALAGLVFGAGFLAFAPTFLLGGLMAFVGLRLVTSWVVDARAWLPRLEYALLVVIAASIAFAGILTGVAVGVVASVLLFAVAYGRIDVVRYELTAAHGASRVTRAPRERDLLAERADAIRILQLQGYLFFGTADRLVRHVERSLSYGHPSSAHTGTPANADADDSERSEPPGRFLVLDFRRVTGVDATAAFGLRKLRQMCSGRGAEVVLVHVSPEIAARLQAVGMTSGEDVRRFADLDRGLEWCEDELLRRAGAHDPDDASDDPLAGLEPDARRRAALTEWFARRDVQAGEILVEQGAPSDGLYVVASGSLTAWLEQPEGGPIRLESVGPGRVLGELGFFLGTTRSASVVADEESIVCCLSREAFERMRVEAPDAALALHQAMVRLLSERVTHLMGVVRALER